MFSNGTQFYVRLQIQSAENKQDFEVSVSFGLARLFLLKTTGLNKDTAEEKKTVLSLINTTQEDSG